MKRGAAFEQAACQYLTERGLVLLARNYRTRYGEIDLVMRDGATLVF
ncbi:MAG: YraN family protein, partial [Limnochordia bacterium]